MPGVELLVAHLWPNPKQFSNAGERCILRGEWGGGNYSGLPRYGNICSLTPGCTAAGNMDRIGSLGGASWAQSFKYLVLLQRRLRTPPCCRPTQGACASLHSPVLLSQPSMTLKGRERSCPHAVERLPANTGLCAPSGYATGDT